MEGGGGMGVGTPLPRARPPLWLSVARVTEPRLGESSSAATSFALDAIAGSTGAARSQDIRGSVAKRRTGIPARRLDLNMAHLRRTALAPRRAVIARILRPDGGVKTGDWWPQRDSNPCRGLERAVS